MYPFFIFYFSYLFFVYFYSLRIISFGKPRQRACLDQHCGRDKTKPHKPEEVGECPECGKQLLKRSGRYGEFIGCSGFPKCRFTCSVEELPHKLK